MAKGCISSNTEHKEWPTCVCSQMVSCSLVVEMELLNGDSCPSEKLFLTASFFVEYFRLLRSVLEPSVLSSRKDKCHVVVFLQ